MKNSLLFALLSISLVAVQAQKKLNQLWQTDSVFKVPESVLFDESRGVLYVTNIDGQPGDRDGKGSVGKLSSDGKVIAVEWVSGLNAPKGMGLYNNRLYVADLTEVVAIDVNNGNIVSRIPVEGAIFLNDITVDSRGVIYVSDSRKRNIHRIQGNSVTTFLDSNSLKGPNGLLAFKKDLYVLDQGKLYCVERDKDMKLIAEGLEGGTDGIENVKGREFIVSSWGGVIYYVLPDGRKEKLLDTREQRVNSADIGYDSRNQIVYVPTFWRNSVVAYKLQ